MPLNAFKHVFENLLRFNSSAKILKQSSSTIKKYFSFSSNYYNSIYY